VPRDGLAGHAEAGLDEPELPVAVRGLVEVHEVHVDLVPRQADVRLRVQVQQRRVQCVQAGDPHLRRRERVHPRDHPDGALHRGVATHAQDLLARGEHRLPDHPDGDLRRLVELAGDLARLPGDLVQRLLAVQPLAAGEEPDLALGIGRHVGASGRRVAVTSCGC
jgi:hypothetical protein